jgi:insertion element IS1 protein InsB
MPTCPTCGSTHTVKNSLTRHDRQNHRCRDCGRQFTQNPTKKTVTTETRTLIDRLLLEKIPLAGIARATNVSQTWLQNYVNHKLENVPQKVNIATKKGH